MLDTVLNRSFRFLNHKRSKDQAFIEQIKQKFFVASSLLILLATFLLGLISWLLLPQTPSVIYLMILAVSLLIQCSSLLYYYYRGRYQFLVKNLIWSHYLIVSLLVLISGGIYSPFVIMFILMPVLCGFLLDERHCKSMLLASVLLVLLLIICQRMGITLPHHPLQQVASLGTILMTLGFLLTVGIFASFEVILRMITQSMAKEKQQFLQQAEYEPLTGMMSYLAFEQLLENSLQEKLDIALFYIDLDNFKSINQVHGPVQGDKVLQQVAANISNCLRNHDVVARVKSDEFAVLVHMQADIDCESLEAVLQQAVNKPIACGDEFIELSARIGYHSTKAGAKNKASLLAIAKSRLLSV